MALDDGYSTLHTQIINMNHLTSLGKVCAMVVQEESHRGITCCCDISTPLGFYAQIDRPNITHAPSTMSAATNRTLSWHLPSSWAHPG